MTDVVVPALGESITEGLLSQWLVADGEAVAVDQPIYELDTDKISTEVQAPVAGVLRHKAAEGDTVEIGAVVAIIEEGAAAPVLAPAPRRNRPHSSRSRPKPSGARRLPADTNSSRQPSWRHRQHVPPMAPAVKQLVADHKLDASTIPATGVGGRS